MWTQARMWISNTWRRYLAWHRWNLDLVCELSKGRGMHDDYHDYPDSTVGEPWHMYTHTCKRCRKEFSI